MSTHYLRTNTRAEMDAALEAAGIPAGGCAWCAVDHIGPILGPFPDGWDNSKTQPVVDSRHHANILLMRELTADMALSLPIIDPPSTPTRGWT